LLVLLVRSNVCTMNANDVSDVLNARKVRKLMGEEDARDVVNDAFVVESRREVGEFQSYEEFLRLEGLVRVGRVNYDCVKVDLLVD